MCDPCTPFLCDTQWLAGNLSRPQMRIIECTYFIDFNESGGHLLTSGKEAWQISHIPNSVFIDLMTELSDRDTDLPFMMPPPEQLAHVMSINGIGNGTDLVIYDRNLTAWATRLWWMLSAVGFDRARVLDGGWHKWLQEGRPTVDHSTAQPVPAEFHLNLRPHQFVNKHEVLKSLSAGDAKLVCGLDEAVFRKGHIPGSLNIPAIQLLEPSTRTFLAVEQLAVLFKQAGLNPADRVITYCGGGIAAACCAFALRLAGYDRVTVYDGSMEEWMRDRRLPLEAKLS